MNTRLLWRGMEMALAVALIAFAGPGCDDTKGSPDTEGVSDYFDENPYESMDRPNTTHYVHITPSSAQVTYVGQAVSFKASGGTAPYTWAVADGSMGSINPSRPNEAIYLCEAVGPNNVLVFDLAGRSAVANINLPGEGAGELQASASPSTLTADGQISVLTATGGTPPYKWSLLDASLGSLDTDTGASVAYTRNRNGDNAVRCTDNNGTGESVILIIKQP